MDNKAENIAAKKPVDSDFLQQRYNAWSPILTPPCIIVLFISVGVLCLAIGIAVLVASGLVKEYMSPPYSTPDHELNDIALYPFPGIHRRNLTIRIDEAMKAPIYFYYQLENVFQNHRRVVFSRSNTQLRGDGVGETAGCDPLEKFNDTELYPCGLLANMFFNDSYTLYVMDNGTPQPLVTQKTGIAWESDRNKKFKRLTRSTVGPELYRLPDVDDEDFIVWMRAAALPSFRKLKYIINSDLPAGTNLVIDIADTFRVASFEGTKRVVLSTTTNLGGKNGFIGGLAIVLGVSHFLLAIFFGLKHKYGERPLGQLSHFGWPSASKQFLSALPKQVS